MSSGSGRGERRIRRRGRGRKRREVQRPAGGEPLARETVDDSRLLHELELHRLELEMQNRELQDANHVLEESRAQYADLYHRAPVAHLTFDVHGAILAANLSAGRLMGTEAHALAGRHFRSLLSVSSRRSFDTVLARAFASGRAATGRVRIGAAGARRLVEVVLAPYVQLPEKTSVCHAAAIDVTLPAAAAERRTTLLRMERRARASAESASAMKEQFLAIVSHELRTPLSAMQMWIAVMETPQLLPELRAKAMRGLAASVDEQVRLIDDLLDTARVTYGKLQLERGPLDLAELTEDVVKQMSFAAAASRVQVRYQRSPDACPVLGDGGRLRQVFGNVLANAVKFSPAGGAIVVSSRVTATRIVMSVRDQGEGIPSDLLPLIFEPFRQRESRAAFRQNGLGLGLFIAAKIVALHDGTISAESPGPGLGATFTIVLPRLGVSTDGATLLPHAAGGPAAVGAPDDERPLAGVTILLVDDHAPSRQALASALQQHGAELTGADSAASARVALARLRPAVVISDLAMPDEDGYTFIRKVRAAQPGDEPVRPLAALALSAQAADRTRQRALDAGFDRFLAKPVDLKSLVSVVVELAGRTAGAKPDRAGNRRKSPTRRAARRT